MLSIHIKTAATILKDNLMKRNKSILHLCEVILGVLMLILILNLYLVKLLVDPDISYTPCTATSA